VIIEFIIQVISFSVKISLYHCLRVYSFLQSNNLTLYFVFLFSMKFTSISYIHLNPSDPSNSIMDNAYITSNLLKTFVEENIFLLFCTYFFGLISCSITSLHDFFIISVELQTLFQKLEYTQSSYLY